MSEQVRCHYDSSLGLDFDTVIDRAVGREADFGGMATFCDRRDLGWFVNSKAEADRIRKRLATCPEVTIVETTDGSAGGSVI